ncbi:MAG: hypothetical protein LBJ31_05750 [Treponema sp.]|nr:hypothetical protein [Treponema sp.]
MTKKGSKSEAGKLVLLAMPLVYPGGAGSAWGMPVVAAGGACYSALDLSLGLDGTADSPVSAACLESLGIGPLGRYLGGERICPVPLNAGALLGGVRPSGSPGLFAGVRLQIPPPANPADLLHAQLEWLRAYGLSGGVILDGDCAAQIASYIRLLKEQCAGKVLVFTGRRFFERFLQAVLDEAAPFAADYGIPLNYSLGGASVLDAAFGGTGIVCFEDMPPAGRKRIPCAVALYIDSGETQADLRTLSPVEAAVKLGIIITNGKAADSFLFRAGVFTQNQYRLLWRDTAELPSQNIKNNAPVRKRFLRTLFRPPIGLEEAEFLGIEDAYRCHFAAGGIFCVNEKFRGLLPRDFLDEQKTFYETETSASFAETESASYSGLDKNSRASFFRWRQYVRGGAYEKAAAFARSAKNETSPSETAYLRIYTRELALGMGREGRMETFETLRELWREYRKRIPAREAVFFLEVVIDFIMIYGLAAECIPLADIFLGVEEYSGGGKTALLLDLLRYYLFVEQAWDRPPGFLPRFNLVAALLPAKIRDRSMRRRDFADMFCRALDSVDSQLRSRWNKSFFEFFTPPELCKMNFTAFDTVPRSGCSSYTAFWPAFSSHNALVETLAALARDTGANPLSGKRIGRPISLETELIESLRRESDEVRGMLHNESAYVSPPPRARAPALSYRKPDAASIERFMEHIDNADRARVIMLLEGHDNKSGISEMDIDRINEAFEAGFGDLLVDGYSITDEYRTILEEWKSRGE